MNYIRFLTFFLIFSTPLLLSLFIIVPNEAFLIWLVLSCIMMLFIALWGGHLLLLLLKAKSGEVILSGPLHHELCRLSYIYYLKVPILLATDLLVPNALLIRKGVSGELYFLIDRRLLEFLTTEELKTILQLQMKKFKEQSFFWFQLQSFWSFFFFRCYAFCVALVAWAKKKSALLWWSCLMLASCVYWWSYFYLFLTIGPLKKGLSSSQVMDEMLFEKMVSLHRREGRIGVLGDIFVCNYFP